MACAKCLTRRAQHDHARTGVLCDLIERALQGAEHALTQGVETGGAVERDPVNTALSATQRAARLSDLSPESLTEMAQLCLLAMGESLANCTIQIGRAHV